MDSAKTTYQFVQEYIQQAKAEGVIRTVANVMTAWEAWRKS